MKKPKLEDYKREVYDGADLADWYEDYYKALEKYHEQKTRELREWVEEYIEEAEQVSSLVKGNEYFQGFNEAMKKVYKELKKQ